METGIIQLWLTGWILTSANAAETRAAACSHSGNQFLPQATFFIEFLTGPGDTVLDIFAGSNTTGRAAEKLARNWTAFEKDRTYLAASAFRFVDELPAEELATLWSQLHSDALPVTVSRQQKELVLMEKPAAYAGRRKRKYQ
jgi:DNA methylase